MLRYLSPSGDPVISSVFRAERTWRSLPFEGHFQLDYRDVSGRRTCRMLHALELKIGPGKVLLGGIDEATQAYRGFRADRISRVLDLDTRETIERNILDWLIRRADWQERQRRRSVARAA